MSFFDILPVSNRRKRGSDAAHVPTVIPVEPKPVLVIERQETETRKKLIAVLRRLEQDATVGPRAMNSGDILKIVACGGDIDELPDLALAMFANGFAKNIGQSEPVLFGPLKEIVSIADLD